MNNKKSVIVYTALVVMFLGLYFYFHQTNKRFMAVTTFEECVRAGYDVFGYPEVCTMPGKKFVNTGQSIEKESYSTTTPIASSKAYLNIGYTIDNESIRLQDGVFDASNEVDDVEHTLSILEVIEPSLEQDLNDDGTKDVALILRGGGGGSGTFYYSVVAFKQKDSYLGSNAIFLGDRIIPLSITGTRNTMIITYKDRGIQEPMTATPTLVMKKVITIRGTTLADKK